MEEDGDRLTLQVLAGRCESAKEKKSQGPPKFLCLHAAQPAHYPWRAGGWEGKRLGGERRRGGGGGRRDWKGELQGGQQAGEGGLKQRAANHPGGIPSSRNQGPGDGPRRPPRLLPLLPGPLLLLAASLSPGTSLLGATTKCYCFLEITVREGRNPWQGSARRWASLHSWHARERWKLALAPRECPQGRKRAALTRQVPCIGVTVP